MEQPLEGELLTVHVGPCAYVCLCCWAPTNGHSTLTTGGRAAVDSGGRHVWQSRTSSVFELGDVLALWGQAEVLSQGSLFSAWQGLQSKGH